MTRSSWTVATIADLLDEHGAEIAEYLSFAARLVSRGLICNTLGNIALRISDSRLPDGAGLLTKRKGVSLEEVTPTDLVVTGLDGAILHWGVTPPSGGHFLNQRIFQLHNDASAGAVIHSHPDVVIGLLSQLETKSFPYVSVDTAIVLGMEPKLFSYGVNPEADVEAIDPDDLRSTCLLMPNHGLTTVGRNLAEAYHRHTSVVAEVNRYLIAHLVARSNGTTVRTISDDEIRQLYALGANFLYA